jgi:hypothetical protein
MKIELQRVNYMPKELKQGVLYVSEEFGSAAHLCACGCGSKIRTPLGPTDWILKETDRGPTLSPSVGNWQLPCQSHYLICQGEIRWANQWTPQQIVAGRQNEERLSRTYYEALYSQRGGVFVRLWMWIKNLFK